MASQNKQSAHRAPVTPERFNEAVWNAWHYGDDATAEPAVKSYSRGEIDNKHSRYYRKQNEKREENERRSRTESNDNMREEDLRFRDEVVSKMKIRSEFRRKEAVKDANAVNDDKSTNCVLSQFVVFIYLTCKVQSTLSQTILLHFNCYFSLLQLNFW